MDYEAIQGFRLFQSGSRNKRGVSHHFVIDLIICGKLNRAEVNNSFSLRTWLALWRIPCSYTASRWRVRNSESRPGRTGKLEDHRRSAVPAHGSVLDDVWRRKSLRQG